LADRLRNVRSSYGAPRHLAVRGTLNGRFSEAQAALVLHSLDDFERRVANNRAALAVYRDLVAQVPGLELYQPPATVISNASYAVVRVDKTRFGLSRDTLVEVLRAENVMARDYFAPGLHRVAPYAARVQRSLPTTEQLCNTLVQLPLGAQAGPAEAARVAEICYEAHEHAALVESSVAQKEQQCVPA
jgi:dTDP-4-amino-4,6-dideoxygalactose transaminase